jgi:hypothetical protein
VPDGSQMKILYRTCVLHAGYLSTHSLSLSLSLSLRICNNYCFSTETMVKRMRPDVTFYVHRLSYFIRTMYDPLHNLKL